MPLSLVIGNKNYSSWSMRPWVLLKHFNIPFTEIMLKFHSPEWDKHIVALSPSRMVPVLWDGEAGHSDAQPVWETIAIFEYVAELLPELDIWPKDRGARARARAMVAEMHAGFRALRSNMPMNIRSKLVGNGHTPEAMKDIARIEQIWREARLKFGHGGSFLFGEFSAADAMFAPVVLRFQTYAPMLAKDTAAYCDAMRAEPAIAQWIADALQEPDFVAEDEPYQTAPPKR
jgi:glutathione S-transferase